MAAISPKGASYSITKTISMFVGGYILFNLWKKRNKNIPNVVIKSLHVYPVKSCKGFEVTSWPISKYGMKYDREWMIYTPKNKRFITQRSVFKIALIKAELMIDNDDIFNVTGIKLSVPKMQSITVPIANEHDGNNRVTDVTLWKDKVSGIDQGDAIAKWLTIYLNLDKDPHKNSIHREYRLLHISSSYHRDTNSKYTPSHLIGKSTASYADGYPFLIVSQSSLNEVNRRLIKKGFNEIPMNRFRPSIVIRTNLDEAFIEDRISRLILMPKDFKFVNNDKHNMVVNNNDLTTFYVIKPCPRCNVPTINQDTAIRNQYLEPTKTLKQFRSGKDLGLEKEKEEQVFFGMNAIHDKANGIITRGDLMLPFFK